MIINDTKNTKESIEKIIEFSKYLVDSLSDHIGIEDEEVSLDKKYASIAAIDQWIAFNTILFDTLRTKYAEDKLTYQEFTVANIVLYIALSQSVQETVLNNVQAKTIQKIIKLHFDENAKKETNRD